MASPGSLLLFCTAQKQYTFGAYDHSTHLHSLLFTQHDGANSVVRRIHLEITTKFAQVPNRVVQLVDYGCRTIGKIV